MLPEPPPTLPPEPRAFYEALRAAVDAEALEVDFGDAGLGLTFPEGIGAQVSRRAAVVFTGSDARHFDEREPGWTGAAATALAAVLNR